MSVRERNLAGIAAVADALGDLAHEVAFVGGATVALYVDDPGAADVRVTDDIDCIIEIASYIDYASVEARLRDRGFVHDATDRAPICRWILRDLGVDIMPTDPAILGFSNQWYTEGLRNRIAAIGSEGRPVYILPLPYFVATKLDAFSARGKRDWLASPDIEDIIAVLDGCRRTEAELQTATGELRAYLRDGLGRLVHHSDAYEIVLSHMPPEPASGRRARKLLELLGHVFAG